MCYHSLHAAFARDDVAINKYLSSDVISLSILILGLILYIQWSLPKRTILYNGQKPCPQRVRYSEAPLYRNFIFWIRGPNCVLIRNYTDTIETVFGSLNHVKFLI